MPNQALITIHEGVYKELTYLLANEPGFEFLYTNLVDEPNSKKQLQMSCEQNEAIIDALTDLMMAKGVTNGEINNFGLGLEGLIDSLNHLDE
jgi:hypothetical protein